ncbi:MAG: hypothetical protein K6A32_09180 [Bacteroidales bacterium]|nr:hypothetical protein [Bacteroidales bacterium]
MKKNLFFFAAIALLAIACTSEKPTEIYIPKNTVEFAGNAFTCFSLGADVKLYSVQNPDESDEWTIQAVVPVRKDANLYLNTLSIDLLPLDDRGIRLRDDIVLAAEDLPNLLPVYNGGVQVERNIVFSIANEDDRYLSSSEVTALLEKTKGVRMDFNVLDLVAPATNNVQTPAPELVAAPITSQVVETPAAKPAPSAPKTYPMTLDGLCRKYGIYGMLSRYDRELRNDNGSAAKRIEDQLWSIEKRVKKDSSIPKELRERFVDYIEDREDEIEDKY